MGDQKINVNAIEMIGDYFNDKTFIPNRLAEEIMKNIHFITMADTEEIYYFDMGVYVPGGEVIIKKMCESFLLDSFRIHYQTEVLAVIRARTYKDRAIFISDKGLLNLKNGILNIEKGTLGKHKPDKFFISQLPIYYDPKKECPGCMDFFERTLETDDIPKIQELFGYCLWRDYTIQTAILFLGEGENGKSVMLDLLTAFLGKDNISSIALQDFGKDRFASANLYERLANIRGDLSTEALYKTGTFKMLTGGDVISADVKFKNRFNFFNYAKLIFSANKPPKTYDKTTAYFRRWIVINFPYVFRKNSPDPLRERDPDLLKKLITKSELSGLLNWALIGLRRLLENGEFTNMPTPEEMEDYWERMSDPISAFCTDCVIKDPTALTPKEKLYSEFVKYCIKEKYPITAKNTFSRDLVTVIPNVTLATQRPRKDGKQIYSWRGIRLKGSEPSPPIDKQKKLVS